jgi:hypothetical protein
MDDPGNNGFINDDFIVWMRTAAFPTFKKLYRRLYRIHYFVEGLPAGNYSFNISYSILYTTFLSEGEGKFGYWLLNYLILFSSQTCIPKIVYSSIAGNTV